MTVLSKSTFVKLAAAALAALSLSGCAAQTTAKANAMWRQMARSYLIGATYDQALIASQQENARGLRQALRELERLDATDVSSDLQLSRAENLVRAAMNLDVKAAQLSQTQKVLQGQIQAEATQRYRSALHWSPEFPSRDPLLLNGLGYFLADRGRTTADFSLSLELTTRAIDLLDKILQQNNNAGIMRREWLRQIEQQRALTRDSLAWGLYKLEEWDRAEATQRLALDEAKSSGLTDSEALAELWWHQSQILQAQGKREQAEFALKEAQRLKPLIGN